MHLDSIRDPADLRTLTYPELHELAGEIRDFIVHAVAANSGHLGSNLGAVELTLAAIKAGVVAHTFMELPRASGPARITAFVTIAFILLLCGGVVGDLLMR